MPYRLFPTSIGPCVAWSETGNCAALGPQHKIHFPADRSPSMNPMRTAIAALGWTLAASASAISAPTTFIPNADHTFVRFSYDHLGFSTQESRFNKTTGTVTL